MGDNACHDGRLGNLVSAILASLSLGCVAVAPRLAAQPMALATALQREVIAVPTSRGNAPQPQAAVLAFTSVTVVDVVDGRLLPAQTVVVTGNRVQVVGPVGEVRVPAGAQVVDARDKYLIPGLWDMHAHVKLHPSAFYPRLIANGVTGIRDMAQRFKGGADSFLVWQRQVVAGTRVGPRAVGPSADLDTYFQDGIATEDQAQRAMDSLKAAGMAFYKYYGSIKGIPRPVFFAILREARRVGLPVVGHRPILVTSVELADSGFRSVEHVTYSECLQRGPADSLAAAERCTLVAQAYIRNGTWVVPTLIAHYYLSKPERREKRIEVSLTRKLHQLGVKQFLAGTDFTESTYVRSGCSVRDELGFLAEAGLTPLEALQAATLNPARFFEATDSLGTVAPGKLADLVLLDANPLVDLKHLKAIRAVVANGRYFDRAALDALDPDGLTTREDLTKYYGFKGQWPSPWGPSHSCS